MAIFQEFFKRWSLIIIIFPSIRTATPLLPPPPPPPSSLSSSTPSSDVLSLGPPRSRCQDSIEHGRNLFKEVSMKETGVGARKVLDGDLMSEGVREGRKEVWMKHLDLSAVQRKFTKVSGESLIQHCLSEESCIFQVQACHRGLATLIISWANMEKYASVQTLAHVMDFRAQQMGPSVNYTHWSWGFAKCVLTAVTVVSHLKKNKTKLPFFFLISTFNLPYFNIWEKRQNKEFKIFPFV